jgi:hypothetical protein
MKEHCGLKLNVNDLYRLNKTQKEPELLVEAQKCFSESSLDIRMKRLFSMEIE